MSIKLISGLEEGHWIELSEGGYAADTALISFYNSLALCFSRVAYIEAEWSATEVGWLWSTNSVEVRGISGGVYRILW